MFKRPGCHTFVNDFKRFPFDLLYESIMVEVIIQNIEMSTSTWYSKERPTLILCCD